MKRGIFENLQKRHQTGKAWVNAVNARAGEAAWELRLIYEKLTGETLPLDVTFMNGALMGTDEVMYIYPHPFQPTVYCYGPDMTPYPTEDKELWPWTKSEERFVDLGKDMWIKVMQMVPLRDAANLGATCKNLLRFARDDAVLRPLKEGALERLPEAVGLFDGQSIWETLQQHKALVYSTTSRMFDAAEMFNDVAVLHNFTSKQEYAVKLFKWACRHDEIEIVRWCVEEGGVNVNIGNKYGIAEAVDFNCPKTIEYLIQQDADVSGNGIVYRAAARGHFEITKLLLANPHIDPSESDNKALELALLCGFKNIAWLLLQDKRVLQTVRLRAVRNAAGRGFQDIVEFILNEKRDII